MSLLNVPELRPFTVDGVRPTGRVLGEGSYGSVEEAEIPGATCVVKKLHEALLPPPTEAHGADRMAAAFVAECRLMSTVRHPHIVQFLGVCLLPGSRLPALIMEKLLIDLHDLLENNLAIPLWMKHDFLVGIAKGLTYLHTRSPAIIHRDLSARNVLLNSAMVAKIADLGNSRIINVRPSQLMTMTKNPGNMWYMPPEAQGKITKYNTSIDVFSFGNLTLFTLTQQFPEVQAATQTDHNTGRVVGLTEIERRVESFEQVYHELGKEHPLVRLAEQCLQNLPSRRPPIAEVLERLEAVGESVRDQYSHLNKLEMVREMKRIEPLRTENSLIRERLRERHQQFEAIQQSCKIQLEEQSAQLEQQDYRLQEQSVQIEQQDNQLRKLEAQLKQKGGEIDQLEVEHRLAIGRQQWRHQEEQERQQQQIASLEAQLRRVKPQGASTQPEPIADFPARPKQPPQAPSKEHAAPLPSAAFARAVVGRERTISILAHNATGALCGPRCNIQAKLNPVESSAGAPISTKILDKGNGRFHVSFTTQQSGYHQLDVVADQSPIKGSPFTIYSRQEISLSTAQQTFNCTFRPWNIAINSTFQLYIIGAHSIEVYDRNGDSIFTIGLPMKAGSGDGEFRYLFGIALREDTMYVSDSDNHRIQILTANGNFISKFGTKGSKDGEFKYPRGICLDQEGRVFVADQGNFRVSVFQSDGKFLYHIKGDSDESELLKPWGLTFDPSGNLHITDRKHECVKVFTARGDYVTQYGTGHLKDPGYIAIDGEGYCFVSGVLKTVSMFDPDHNVIEATDGFRSMGVAIDIERNVYVVDFSRAQVLMF